MAAVGQASLVVALVTALYAGAAAFYGAHARRRFVVSARRAVYCLAALLRSYGM